MPMRRRPASRSTRPAVSAHTRATTAPTVRQAMRISSVTALFEHTVANPATVGVPRRGRSPGCAAGTPRTVAAAPARAGPTPRSHPRLRRSRHAQPPSSRPRAAQPIPWHYARRSPPPTTLTFDKPEPRQDNGVRYLRRAEPTHGSVRRASNDRMMPALLTVGARVSAMMSLVSMPARRLAVMMSDEAPSGLLYVLTVGREKELVLRIHGKTPSTQDLFAWMRDATVRELTVSRHGDDETSTLVLNFGHVVGARVAPYSDTRSGSF